MKTAAQKSSAADLRQDFDAAFARPLQMERPQTVELLAVGASETRMAMRVIDIRAIQLCPPVTELPSSAPAFIGIGAVRNAIAGLYSLGMLRGGAKSPVAGQWVITCGDGTVGLVFDELFGYARVQATDFGHTAGASGVALDFVDIEGRPHLVVDIAALLKEIVGT